jgi:hypothetical protein
MSQMITFAQFLADLRAGKHPMPGSRSQANRLGAQLFATVSDWDAQTLPDSDKPLSQAVAFVAELVRARGDLLAALEAYR